MAMGRYWQAILMVVAITFGSHAGDAQPGECFAHLVELERFDDRLDLLHKSLIILSSAAAPGWAGRLWENTVRACRTVLSMAAKVSGPVRSTSPESPMDCYQTINVPRRNPPQKLGCVATLLRGLMELRASDVGSAYILGRPVCPNGS
mgnify:CR=1 FL=1